jgi:hypothetical protein
LHLFVFLERLAASPLELERHWPAQEGEDAFASQRFSAPAQMELHRQQEEAADKTCLGEDAL